MPSAPRQSTAPRTGLLLLGILVVTTLAYARLGGNGFINWDDPVWVIDNPAWSAPSPLRTIWLSLETHQYYPLYFSLLWVQHLLFGSHAAGYHWVSLAQHLLAVTGLYGLLRRLRFGSTLTLVATLAFALHPIQVAAVAWATEQKTVLSTALVLFAFERYLAWQEQRDERHYATSLALFFAAMLTKSQPLLLALLFPMARPLLGRVSFDGAALRREAARLAPFFLLALALAIPTVIRERAPLREGNLSLIERALVMSRGVFFYLTKIAWPNPLSGLYSFWRIDPRVPSLWLWLAGALALTALVIRLAGRHRVLAFAALFFVLPWLPASGLVPFGHLEKSYVADHLIYASLIGPALLIGLFIEQVISVRVMGGALRTPGIALAAVLLLGYGVATFGRTFDYADSEHFWAAVLEVDPASPSAHNNLGVELATRGRIDDAIAHYQEAIRLKPGYYEVRVNYARALEQRGDTQGAIDELETALRVKPGDAAASAALERLGARRIEPDQESKLRAQAASEPANQGAAQIALARFLTDSGRGEEAADLLNRALARPFDSTTRAAVLGELGYVDVSLMRRGRARSVPAADRASAERTLPADELRRPSPAPRQIR
ncbi:MAG: tetratricopeptide repeat protein [Candidatus Eisenbacteria bacterium]